MVGSRPQFVMRRLDVAGKGSCLVPTYHNDSRVITYRTRHTSVIFLAALYGVAAHDMAVCGLQPSRPLYLTVANPPPSSYMCLLGTTSRGLDDKFAWRCWFTLDRFPCEIKCYCSYTVHGFRDTVLLLLLLPAYRPAGRRLISAGYPCYQMHRSACLAIVLDFNDPWHACHPTHL
jgi:hypothetical protein